VRRQPSTRHISGALVVFPCTLVSGSGRGFPFNKSNLLPLSLHLDDEFWLNATRGGSGGIYH
jgi:hypothetical protein